MLALDHLEGTLAYLGGDPLHQQPYLVLQVHGLGWSLSCLERTARALQAQQGQIVRLFCRPVFRTQPEPGAQLFGFVSRSERDLFHLLLGASGVGPKAALALLEALSVDGLLGAVMAEDYKALTVAKGVGAKLAQKLLLDLKEKLTAWYAYASISGLDDANEFAVAPQAAVPSASKIAKGKGVALSNEAATKGFSPATLHEAQTVLGSLGYSPQEIHTCLRGLAQCLPENLPKVESSPPPPAHEWNSERLLRYALKWLATQV
jgi:holliday junction DNA helicase RuvA